MSEPKDICRRCNGTGETTRTDKDSGNVVVEACYHGAYIMPSSADRVSGCTDLVLAEIKRRFGEGALK